MSKVTIQYMLGEREKRDDLDRRWLNIKALNEWIEQTVVWRRNTMKASSLYITYRQALRPTNVLQNSCKIESCKHT